MADILSNTVLRHAEAVPKNALPAGLVKAAQTVDLSDPAALTNGHAALPIAAQEIRGIVLMNDDIAILADSIARSVVIKGFFSALLVDELTELRLADGTAIDPLSFLETYGENGVLGDILNSLETAAGDAETPVPPFGADRSFDVDPLVAGARMTSGALPEDDGRGTGDTENADTAARSDDEMRSGDAFDAGAQEGHASQSLDDAQQRSAPTSASPAPESPAPYTVEAVPSGPPIEDQTLPDPSPAPFLRETVTLTGRGDIYSAEASGTPVDVMGGRGRDRITGSAGDDRLSGEAGRDTLIGGMGDDILDGGRGRDRLDGDGGDDTLIGGAGRDMLSGGDGDDTFILSGRQDSQDLLSGGEGIDTVRRDDGDLVFRRFVADNGIERVDARGAEIHGTGSRDEMDFSNADLIGTIGIDGGGGRDRIIGSAGDDRISGGAGRDTLIGGAGDDILDGGRGRDRLEGGDGGDTFVLGQGIDTIVDFDSAEGDRLDVSSIIDVPQNEPFESYLRLEEDGNGNTEVLINPNGSGDDGRFSRAAVLEGTTGLRLDDIVAPVAEETV